MGVSVMALLLPGCVVSDNLYDLSESGRVVGRIRDNKNKEKYSFNGNCYYYITFKTKA